MVQISLCMIVKNEEEHLARCINSLKDIPDEIIIVDTGSLDKTKEIAKTFTPHVYDFEWIDDFAAARNFSLSKATKDFIYVADGDEVLDEENYQKFKILKKALKKDVEMVEFIYQNERASRDTENFKKDYRPKLFLKERPFLFMDPIHETLRTYPVIFRSDIVIRHLPKETHTKRDLEIFKKTIGKGIRLSQRLEMMYARELLFADDINELILSREYFEKTFEKENPTEEESKRAAIILSWIGAKTGDGELLLSYAAPELIGNPVSEICCAFGDYYYNKNKMQIAIEWYQAAINTLPELIAIAAGTLPLRGLANCYKKLGQHEKAKDYQQMEQCWEPENLF